MLDEIENNLNSVDNIDQNVIAKVSDINIGFIPCLNLFLKNFRMDILNYNYDPFYFNKIDIPQQNIASILSFGVYASYL